MRQVGRVIWRFLSIGDDFQILCESQLATPWRVLHQIGTCGRTAPSTPWSPWAAYATSAINPDLISAPQPKSRKAKYSLLLIGIPAPGARSIVREVLQHPVVAARAGEQQPLGLQGMHDGYSFPRLTLVVSSTPTWRAPLISSLLRAACTE